MAELAIGISKTAVEALVNKVKSAIKEEAEKWQIVERGIVFIKDEFEMMQSFLNSTSGDRMKNQVARTWVRQVRDLSYDTEDCIDFVLNMDTKRSLSWQRLLGRRIVPTTMPLDQAVADIKLLKARAEDVNQRNIRYSLTGSTGEQMLHTSAANQTTLGIFIKPRNAYDNLNSNVDLTSLIKIDDEGLQVISVCGTGGGLGTISIIKKAYDDPQICETFKCRSWVKLTHPFNRHEFMRSLLAGISANSTSQEQKDDIGVDFEATMKATKESIITNFKKRIQHKKYLIVLEDLLSIGEWNFIRAFMPDLKNKSRIVISTHQLEIASLCTGQPNQARLLHEFSTEHSVYAFYKELPNQQGSKPDAGKCTRGQSQLWLLNPDADHWRENHSLYGRESDLNKLVDQISIAHEQKKFSVISVCGIAGVGKSFLVGALYDHFAAAFDSYGWVSASHPFHITNFCKNLNNSMIPQPECKEENIILQTSKHLETKQCLVVIDNLLFKNDWDMIEDKLTLGASRSCIIVTTREESIARHCATSDQAVCTLKGLESAAARSLLEETSKNHGTSRWLSAMVDEAELIINKCGRHPKQIVDLVKYLAVKPNLIREAQHLNANFIYALKTREGLDSFREFFAWIYSKFQAYPPLLKKCIFYLSIFTQSNIIIRRSRLVRRWIAEGYSEGTDSNSIVEYTESNLIHKLANLGMMEHPQQKPSKVGGINSCQINSFLLNYVISRETDENIFLPLEVSLLQGEDSLGTQHAGQHLSIASSWKRDKFVFDNVDFSRLRSLTVSREWKPFLLSDRMKVLRVLDVESTDVDDCDIEQIVKQVSRLKFLSLRRCTKVSCLPDSLGNLRQLQTLDIRHTSVTKLPKTISKLQKLQYIRAATRVAWMEEEPSTPWRSSHGPGRASDGVMVPGSIGSLMALHTLGVVNIDAGVQKNAFLKNLKNLIQLNKLGVSGINRKNLKPLLSAIQSHRHLVSLSLQIHSDSDLAWIGKMTLPGNLQRLKMYVHIVTYPNWSCLQVLGEVKRLKTLSLRFETDQDVELQFCNSMDSAFSTYTQFSELKVLEIACSSNLHVKFVGYEMYQLEMLKVHCFNGSSLKFTGIDQDQQLKSLKHVLLKGSFDDTVKEDLRRTVTQHKNKPTCELS